MSEHVSIDPTIDDDGWFLARCSCGFEEGPFPDIETMVDGLMFHAYQAGWSEHAETGRP